MDKENDVYKDIAPSSQEDIVGELKKELLKFKDPVVLGSLMFKVLSERENSNRILKNIYTKLEALEARISRVEENLPGRNRPKAPVILPDVDKEILAFIKQRGMACAEDVKKSLNYKGKNAASARLNKLFEQGVLEKKQAGRTVYYITSLYWQGD
ncbi:winged helix-turn-helix transcriptional regulator [Candidatus Micrarchaeota archaeon]|nr:winged helix-turn-helix transcriptional regulator [Candidatus Micrarchaeota archaeon]